MAHVDARIMSNDQSGTYCCAAMQSRRVDCIQGGRVVDDTQCKGQTTPVTTQTCRAEECVAIWVLGDWSQVPT